MLVKVELGKSIEGKDLEGAILGAAKALGLRYQSADNYELPTYTLNPVRKKEKAYDFTAIQIEENGAGKYLFKPFAEISIKKHQMVDGFYMNLYCLSSEITKRYLDAVSQRIR